MTETIRKRPTRDATIEDNASDHRRPARTAAIAALPLAALAVVLLLTSRETKPSNTPVHDSTDLDRSASTTAPSRDSDGGGTSARHSGNDASAHQAGHDQDAPLEIEVHLNDWATAQAGPLPVPTEVEVCMIATEEDVDDETGRTVAAITDGEARSTPSMPAGDYGDRGGCVQIPGPPLPIPVDGVVLVPIVPEYETRVTPKSERLTFDRKKLDFRSRRLLHHGTWL